MARKSKPSLTLVLLTSVAFAISAIVSVSAEPPNDTLTKAQVEAMEVAAVAAMPELAANPSMHRLEAVQSLRGVNMILARAWFGPILETDDRKEWIELACNFQANSWSCDNPQYQRIVMFSVRPNLWIKGDLSFVRAAELMRFLEKSIKGGDLTKVTLTKQEYDDIWRVTPCSDDMICVFTRNQSGIPSEFRVLGPTTESDSPEYVMQPIEWH